MHKYLSFTYEPWPCSLSFSLYCLDEKMRAIHPSSKYVNDLIIMPSFVVAFLRQESLKHGESVGQPFKVSSLRVRELNAKD